MTIISIILGVLLVISGFSCMFTPLKTFFSTGYFLGIILLVYGIAGVLRIISRKEKADALEWIMHILSIIIGLIALFRPGTTLVFDAMLLTIIACWFVVQGVIQIVLSFKLKNVKKGWYWGLIAGILGVILGIYSFMHPGVTAVTTGILIGFYFVESGFSLIALALAVGSVEE